MLFRIFIDESHNETVQSNDSIFVLSYRRWLKKVSNISKQNLPPFTLTGAINDAIFLLPDDIRNNPEEFMRKYFQKYSSFGMTACRWTISAPDSRNYGVEDGPFGKALVKQLQFANRTFGICSTKMGERYEYPSELLRPSGHFRFELFQPHHPWINISFIGLEEKVRKTLKNLGS